MSIARIISQIVNIFGTGFNMIGVNMKDKRKCLIFFILGNSCISIALGLVGAISGMIVHLIFVLETIINYIYEEKTKKTKYPLWLIALYIIIPSAILVSVYNTPWDLLPILAGVLFPLAILSKDFLLRLLNLLSIALWIPYDFVFGQYVGTISCIALTIMNFVAIIRLDIKHKK